MEQHLPDMQEGDIFYTQYDQQYHFYKLLRRDDRIGAFHVLSYATLDELPPMYDTSALTISIYHLPMHAESFIGATRWCNSPVTDDELIGYYTYMGGDDAEFEAKAEKAEGYYAEAYLLTDQGKLEEAIETYSKAVDLIPEFHEAIDNRAFCKMDLGRWQDAIADFELSLSVHPDSLLAEFSIGECYYRMGDLAHAHWQFEKCVKLDPSHQVSRDFLQRTAELMRNAAEGSERTSE